MRTTGPTLRRRNARWSRHQRRQFRALHEDEDHGDHGDHSDSDSGSEADDEDEATPRFYKPAVQPNTVVSVGGVATPAPNLGSGLDSSTGLPGVTLGAGEEDLDAEEEDEDEEVEGEEDDDSSSDSDDELTDGDQSSSDDDSDEETTLPPPGPPGTSTTLPAIAPPAGVSTIPPAATTSPSAGASPVLAPIGGIVGEPTATTSSTIAAGTPQGGIMSQVQPTTSTSTRDESSQTTSSPSATVPISETITASPPPAADLPNPPAADFPNSAGGVDRIVTSTPEPTSLAESSPVLSEGGGGMETGAAAGIIIGVLAFVGILLIGGWFLYKKWRSRDSESDSGSSSGLPRFLNQFRSSENRSTYAWKFWDSNSSAGTRSTMGAPVTPTPQLPVANKKTNSEMVDDLMRAAYAAESGGNHNDLESRVGYLDEKALVPAQVNEQTYKALFGNGPNSPMPPAVNNQGSQPANGGNGMMRWLDGTVTPHESRFGPPPSTAGLRAEQDWPPMPQQPQGNINQPYDYR